MVIHKIALPPKTELTACLIDTKQATLVDSLSNGCTMQDLLVKCRPWTLKSIKSGIYWDVNKVKGYGVTTIILPRAEVIRRGMLPDDTENMAVYFLTYPSGVFKPLPHKPRKRKK